MANNKNNNKKTENAHFLPFDIYSTALIVLCPILLGVVIIYGFLSGNRTALKLSFLLLAVYVSCAVIIGALYRLHSKKSEEKKLNDALGKRTTDFPFGILADFKEPIALCDEKGTIVWRNESFCTRSAYSKIFSDSLDLCSFFDLDGVIGKEERPQNDLYEDRLISVGSKISSADISDMDSTSVHSDPELFRQKMEQIISKKAWLDTRGLERFGGYWRMYVYPHVSNGVHYFLHVFVDKSDYVECRKFFNFDSIHIAYLSIDNLDEIAQTNQSQYRSASTQIDLVIKTWAEEYHSFIKEYEREKYVLAMSHGDFIEAEKTEFDILERVSLAKIGKEELSITVSMGISDGNGTLTEKEKSAQNAFEMALQRGGNQVVCDGTPMKFYGAKAITNQKRSGVRHRVFAEKLLYHLRDSDKVVIMAHRSPDFDAIGSCLGIAKYARANTSAEVYILANPEDKNLKECFDRLFATGSSYYRDLFISATVAQSYVSNNHSLLICTDVNNIDNFESKDVCRSAQNIFIIDHHRQSENTPETVENGDNPPLTKVESLIVPSASSATELVTEIIRTSKNIVRLNRTEADIMLAGMMLDTKNFTRNVQVATYEAAIFLRENGADPVKAQSLFKTDLSDFKQEGQFASDLESYMDFIVIAKENSADSSAAKRINAAKTADRLLNIKNIKASFVLTRMSNDVFISARSDGSVNVQIIMETLKGGGHYNAAATMVKDMDVDTATESLKKAIDKYFDFENGASK